MYAPSSRRWFQVVLRKLPETPQEKQGLRFTGPHQSIPHAKVGCFLLFFFFKSVLCDWCPHNIMFEERVAQISV